MGRFFCKSHHFPLLIASFLYFLPFSISLSTFTISETSNFTLVCALLPSLNCSTLSGTRFQTPFDPNVSFTGIVSGDGFLCGLRPSFSSPDVSVMRCWRFFNNGTTMEFKRIYNGPALTQLEAGNSHICGLNETNALECWQWPEFNQTGGYRNFSSIAVGEGFVCGLSKDGKMSCHGNVGSVSGQERRGNYSVVAAGFRHACAISRDNDLECWGDTVVDDTPTGKFNALALGLNRSCALRTNGTVVCWGQNNFTLPQELERRSFITIKAKRNIFCGVSTLDYSLLCWGDSRFNSSSIVFSEVPPGPCRNTCPCGIVSGSGSFCGNGGSICKPCVSISLSLPSAPSPQPQNRSTNSNFNGRMVAFLVVGCVGSFSLLLVLGFFVFRYCNGGRCRIHDSGRLDETNASAYGVSSTDKPQTRQASLAPAVLEKRLSQLTSVGCTICLEEISLDNLIRATNNFSEDHKIGVGSFGSVYRATFDDGREVAIKRAEATSISSYAIGTRRQEDKDDAFFNEIEYLSRLHHRNLVRLLGFCEDADERVLVYEYMNNGTLHDHLHNLQSLPFMSWATRLKIALDAARGIEYLHEYAVPQVIHRDIKSSNILLDTSWTTKVSDFGLSLLGPDDESHLSLRAAGTVGYMDPEYYRLQRLTTKSDVYSFGVVLLELLSGLKAIHMNENGTPRNVVDFVVPYIVRDEIHRVLDRRVPQPSLFEIEGVESVGHLAAACVTPEGRERPSMFEVVKCLEQALTSCLRPPTLSRSSTESST